MGASIEGKTVRRLGNLEATIMDLLWEADAPVTVRDVLAVLTDSRPLAYTTVMTVLDNLHRKGFVERTMESRAWRYRAASSRGKASADAMREILSEAGDAEAALLMFATSVSDSESEVLRSALDRRKRKG